MWKKEGSIVLFENIFRFCNRTVATTGHCNHSSRDAVSMLKGVAGSLYRACMERTGQNA